MKNLIQPQVCAGGVKCLVHPTSSHLFCHSRRGQSTLTLHEWHQFCEKLIIFLEDRRMPATLCGGGSEKKKKVKRMCELEKFPWSSADEC